MKFYNILRSKINSNDLKTAYKGIGDLVCACLEYFPCTPKNVELPDSLKVKPTYSTIVSYGMTALVDVLIAFYSSFNSFCLQIQTPFYFETKIMADELFAAHVVEKVDYSEQLQFLTGKQVLICELHPNDANSSIPITNRCLNLNTPKDDSPRALIIDCTSNCLNDQNLFLNSLKDSVENNDFAVVLIQSLAKFAQLGVDVATGGLLCVWTSSKPTENYETLQKNIEKFASGSLVPGYVHNYFSFLLSKDMLGLQLEYLGNIRKNTQYLNDLVLKTFSEYGLIRTSRMMDVLLNMDRGSFYLSFNFKNLWNCFTYLKDEKKLENCVKMIENLFHCVFDSLKLPITERISFGFPISNLSNCSLALRFTVGIEDESLINTYSEAIAIVAFILQWFEGSDPETLENFKEWIDKSLLRVEKIFSSGFELKC